ncbi:hypothetical protein ACM66B_005794 [Microbotryomycetes sp. NB124-2]
MCVIYWSSSDRYQLIVAANRDEFLSRPTTRACFHHFEPPSSSSPTTKCTTQPTNDDRTLSGLDLTAGGTWLGLSLGRSTDDDKQSWRLRLATLTNVTETIDHTIKRPSRGQLVKQFLQEDGSPHLEMDEFLQEVEKNKMAFAGFNLVVGELSKEGHMQLGYVSNREEGDKRARRIQVPQQGQAKGVSNATLESTAREPLWPKVVSGSEKIEEAVVRVAASRACEAELVEELWRVLSTANPAHIRDRTHLRHTILVRPLMMDPHAPLSDEVPAFKAADDGARAPAVDELGPDYERLESDDNHWYATRVQTVVLVERAPTSGKLRVVFREREAYTLVDGKPAWSGDERVFEFAV